MSPQPAPSRQRIAALDVVRGVALAGILLANVFIFFAWIFIPPELAEALPTPAIDGWVDTAVQVLVAGKFYSIFSLLFGIGFGLQLARGGNDMLPRFRRRLRILLLIGVAHAVFLWSGDILMMYALLGFTLPWFARRSDRSLLKWSAVLLATPTLLYLVAVVVAAALGVSGAGSSDPPEEIIAIIARMGSGGLGDAFIGNLVMLVGRWIEVIVTVRLPKVLGMFVLGLWVVRRGVLADPAAHRPLLVACRQWGLGAGLVVNAFAVWATVTWPYGTVEPASLLGVLGQGIGYPLLAVGYASAVALAVIDAGRLGWMAPVGRMALTNYLMHSLVCVTLSYGFGFGLWWQVGASTAVAIALAIVAVQVPLSRWWLTHYRFGPAEWVWRRLTYRQPLSMRV